MTDERLLFSLKQAEYMKNDIKSKLQNELAKPIESEVQVIYILARIRKLLEIEGKKESYQFLNFYCNWALHAKIDKIGKKVEHFLKQVDEDAGVATGQHMYFSYFHDEFQKFLTDLGLTASIYDPQTPSAKNNFNRLLLLIYSDTPLILKTIFERELTFSDVQGSGGSYSFSLSGTNKT